ncbi:MAG: hypothetical protein JOY66_14460 [Acetobacteraceae bacterium]|nr:hypothetical protein [Acetobacteraceae bacterium]
MTTMIVEVYDALRDAGAGEEKARKAAEVLANYEDRFPRIDTRLERFDGRMGLLQWMIGANFALTLAVFVKLFVH